MREQELSEGGVVVRKRAGELRLLEVAGEAFGERRRHLNRFLDNVGKFGRMGSRQNQTLRRLGVAPTVGLPGVNTDGRRFPTWERSAAQAKGETV